MTCGAHSFPQTLVRGSPPPAHTLFAVAHVSRKYLPVFSTTFLNVKFWTNSSRTPSDLFYGLLEIQILPGEVPRTPRHASRLRRLVRRLRRLVCRLRISQARPWIILLESGLDPSGPHSYFRLRQKTPQILTIEFSDRQTEIIAVIIEDSAFRNIQ